MTVPAWCARLGMTVPVVQAPIGSACTPELAAAVSGAGALGMLAGSWLSRPELVRQIRDVRTVTSRSFGVNLVLDRPQHERLGIVLDLDVSVVSTFWGDPEPYRARIADHGALHLHTVGSSAEARCAVAAGVDLVVAQGWDAGGHVRGRTGTFSLVPAVVDAVAPVPVIAAGGIADVRGVAAAFALGAQGVWVGSRFLLAEESAAHPHYRERLIAAVADDTAYTLAFADGWPDAPHRALRNSTLDRWEAVGGPRSGARPGEGEVVAQHPALGRVLRYADVIPVVGHTGDIEAMAQYAGQGVELMTGNYPAATIVAELARGELSPP